MLWSESWRAPEAWLAELETVLRTQEVIVVRGSDYDRWDLYLRGGMFGGMTSLMAIEEHGAGKQLARFRTRARVPTFTWTTIGVLGVLATLALLNAAWVAGASLVVMAVALVVAVVRDCATARHCWEAALRLMNSPDQAGA
jgi:hypothetical protein